MRQSFNHRIILLAGTAFALSVGIAQAQAPAPPTPNAPPVMRATLNTQPTATTNEVTRLVMQIRGHEIEIVVRNGVPTYRIDNEWQGKDKFRNTTDGGFIFDGPDGQPLLTLTAQQAADMGLTQRADIPRQRATGTPSPAVQRQIRIDRQRDTTTNATSGVVREELANVQISTSNGVVVDLGRDGEGQAWTVREYKLDGIPMSADAYKVTPDRVELFDGDGKTVDVIELADLNRITVSQPAHPNAPRIGVTGIQPPMLSRSRPMLGITMAAVPESLAAQLGIERDSGVLIGSVMPGQAAEEAGLRAQDVLLWIEEEGNHATFDTVREALEGKSSGDTIELGVIRGGKPMRMKATLREGVVGQYTAGTSVSGTVTGRPGRIVDSVSRALEAERADITTQIQEHEVQLKVMTERLGSASGLYAEQLSREAAEITRRIAELSAKSATLAEREQENTRKLMAELIFGGRSTSPPSTPIPPQRWSLSEDDGGMYIFENPAAAVRRAIPDEQLIAGLRDQTIVRIEGLADRVDRLGETLDQRLSGINGLDAGTLRSFTQLPGTIDRIERLERESAERARQIEQRLERIERLLEELAARQR